MASITIPSFSLPLTRTEHNARLVLLARDFESQGLEKNDARTKASQVITFRSQGLTNAQIEKNFRDTEDFEKSKTEERNAKVLAEQEKQKDLLDKLAKEKAEREKLARSTQDRESRTLEEIRNFGKTNEVLVANPKDPRGSLIPKSLADQFKKELDNAGLRAQDQSSIAQKNNPSILDSIRNLVSNQKTGTVEVVDVNRTSVLLSDGSRVDRADFKGTIPEKFLTQNVKTPTPDNAPLGGVTTIKGQTKIVDPTKTVVKVTDPTKTTGKRPSKSVFQNDKPETTPVADGIKSIQDAITNVVNPDKSKTDSKPFDPVGDLVNFFTPKETAPKPENPIQEKAFDPLGDLVNFFTPKETAPETPIPETPKTTDPTKPELTTEPENKPKPTKEPETLDKFSKFIGDNGIKIVVGGIATIAILGISLSMLPPDNGILKKRLN